MLDILQQNPLKYGFSGIELPIHAVITLNMWVHRNFKYIYIIAIPGSSLVNSEALQLHEITFAAMKIIL